MERTDFRRTSFKVDKISTFNSTYVQNSSMAVIPLRYQTTFIITEGYHQIENINFEEALKITDNSPLSSLVPFMGARLILDSNSKNVVVSRCCFAKLEVSGTSHNINDVFVAFNVIRPTGSSYKFTSCKFGELSDEGTVKTECVVVPEWLEIVNENAEIYHM